MSKSFPSEGIAAVSARIESVEVASLSITVNQFRVGHPERDTIR